MKKYNFLILIMTALLGAFFFNSCSDDFLTASSTEKRAVGDPATEEVIVSFLTSAYQILLFDSYADCNYNSVMLMSDLRSDDIYRGGENAGDQNYLYKLSIFESSSTETLHGLWNLYYAGLSRCNNVLDACNNPVNVDETKLEQYKAEALFLRAYYMHLLWKFFGNVPYFEKALESPYLASQYQADEVYAEIMEDLEYACADGRLPMKATAANLGRASRAAALMLKARVVLYQKDQSRYAEITNDMATIIGSGQFNLMESFADIWTEANEFCDESIFESNQYGDNEGRWDNGWVGSGTVLPALISPRQFTSSHPEFESGWGFAPVRPEAFKMYEGVSDTRRRGSINSFSPGTQYVAGFQDTGYFLRKYAARKGYAPPTGNDAQVLNYGNNLRIFRYAETLLNYVELVKMHGQSEAQGVSAQGCLDEIRRRAFSGTDNPIPATPENIKLERRREFLGEGMRFWDLIRWGDAESVLTENNEEFSSVRTFQDWKKYLPIPQGEMDKTKGTEFELKQNGLWK